MPQRITPWLLASILIWAGVKKAAGAVLWSDLGATLVYQTGVGNDILEGAVKRDESSTDTLYFKFHIDPISDASTEEYFAAFELYDKNEERLGLGNALKAWAYSAFTAGGPGDVNPAAPYIDLHSSRPEASGHGSYYEYENPHRGLEMTILFKVQYVVGGEDLVTVWLNPDLGPGATEGAQPGSLITQFTANASFDEIHLRHGGGGGGWIFSDMEIATSFSDFVNAQGNDSNDALSRLVHGDRPVTFHYWQREQGLPQNLVRALTQTKDGYLWIGNDDGVARFDGVRFVPFGLREGLNSGPVQTLFGDREGSLWIGTSGGGLTHWDGEKFTTYTVHDGLPSDAITAVSEDNQGRLWIGTKTGLATWKDGRVSLFPGAEEFKGKAVTTLFNDPAGNMWLGVAGTGVFQYAGGRFQPLQDVAVQEMLQDAHCILVDHKNRTWIAVGDGLVLCHDGTRWQPCRIPAHQSKIIISSLAEGTDDTIWAGSAVDGLFQIKNGRAQPIDASSGLSDRLIESLLVDQEGGLWVGTHGGLNRLRPRNLFALGQKEGLGYGAVQSMAEVAPGIIWVGKTSDGAYVWEGGKFRHLASPGLALGGPQVNALLMALDGSCWMAGARGLLHFKHPGPAVDQAEFFSNIHGTALMQDREGILWVGTREGRIWRNAAEKWTEETNHAQTHPITVMCQDRAGYMWVGTEGSGLERFRGRENYRIDNKNGLLNDFVRTLYLDEQGVAWIGTAGGGLTRWRNGEVFTFTMREGLPDNTVSQLLEDADGRLWLGSGRGIACISKADLEDLAAGKIPVLSPIVYGRTDGMASEECTGGFSPAGLKTKAGQLWFSTLKGIVVVDPRRQMSDSTKPKVLLEEVLLDGVEDPEFHPARPAPQTAAVKEVSNPQQEFLHVTPGKHRVEFRFTGLNFDAPERIRFRYQLDGLDPDWLEAGGLRSALYNYIPPGRYTFRVAARNASGAWVESAMPIGLIVLPHFWQEWWVIVCGGCGILLAVGAGVRVFEKRKSQRRLVRLEQEKALERERMRIAQDLHDEMGAKLCRISFLSEHARRIPALSEEARRQIVSISDSSREVLTSMDEIVWAINPRNDLLEHVVSYIGHYAREYFQETGIECDLDIPAQAPAYPLSSQVRHHLLLAVHEAFTNILKHSRATRSRVSVTCDQSKLEIVIWDNGRGFEPPASSNGTDGGGGNGLRNMRQRMVQIGGSCLVQAGPGGGSVVHFILPLGRHSAQAKVNND
jgi:ligand-binding sensor domain-containing protein/signal transduction histidine kinase